MIPGIRTTVASLGLALDTLSSLPQDLLAADATPVALPRDRPATRPTGILGLEPESILPARAPGLTAAPRLSFFGTEPRAQGYSAWSTYGAARKTWLIVAFVLGAGAGAAVLSRNRHRTSGNSESTGP